MGKPDDMTMSTASRRLGDQPASAPSGVFDQSFALTRAGISATGRVWKAATVSSVSAIAPHALATMPGRS